LEQGEKVTLYGIIINVILTFLKFAAGILGKSGALIADAVHSSSDILATGTVFISLKIAKLPRDESHPYGHGKIESLAAAFVGLVLLIAGGYILREAIVNLIEGIERVPGNIAFLGAISSIVIKEILFRYTLRVGKKLNSPAIIANAWDHRSDAYSSIGVLIGITGARLGYAFLDPIAAGIVSLFILKIALELLYEATQDLMDRGLNEEMTQKIRDIAMSIPEVKDAYYIRGRRMGSQYFVDMNLRLYSFSTTKEGHDITEVVRDKIEQELPRIGDVRIHLNVAEKESNEFIENFQNRVKGILADHREHFLEIHDLDFHFSGNKQEVHFHLVLLPGTNLEQAHRLSEHLEDDIKKELKGTDVVIHFEPSSDVS